MKPGNQCPICKRSESLSTKPFCSKRCQQVDLGRWLKGGYVVPGRAEDDSEQYPDDIDK